MGPDFIPTPGAEGWQLSNPPIFALAPLRVSLEIFHRAGMPRLREKSIALTGYLETLIRKRLSDVLDIATPPKLEQRGCQLSLRVRGPRESGRLLYEYLLDNGVIVDWREPDIIRAAPTPLYNRFEDCIGFVDAVSKWTQLRDQKPGG
jgi:kynureninase